jgi:hypothetical protein
VTQRQGIGFPPLEMVLAPGPGEKGSPLATRFFFILLLCSV